jgi:hypothetical protein
MYKYTFFYFFLLSLPQFLNFLAMKHFRKNQELLIGHEYPLPDEDVYIDRMVADMQKQLNNLYPPGKTLRQAHSKMHGCVKAEFTVPDDIDSALKVGIFKNPGTYAAYIRFSNAETKIKHDIKGDVRGMAIKILDVPGEKLVSKPSDAQTQDFVLISHEVFVSRNVKEFHKLMHAVCKGKWSKLPSVASFMVKNPSVGIKAFQSRKKCEHVLKTSFWSTTPYLFGTGMAVKYSATPANDFPVTGGIVASDKNYLRSNLVKTLAQQDAYFDFKIQFQTDPYRMPVEDPTVRWTSPFFNVAKIKIPKQVFDTEELDNLGNDFSFSPWHSLPEHRPIGGFNRARKKIYHAMSDFWQDRNS